MSYNPDYRPTGPNNRSNEYYKKINHVRIARNMASRSEFYGSPISITPGGVAPSEFAYTEGMRLDAHPDYFALTSIANWQTGTEAAIIDFAGFLVDGSAKAGGYFVQPGETVTLLVTDSAVPASQYEYTIDASVDAFILQQPQPVDIMEGSAASFSVVAPTAVSYQWEYSTDGAVWQSGSTSNLKADYPSWVGSATSGTAGGTWQITSAHFDMNGMVVRCSLDGGAFVTDEVATQVSNVVEPPVFVGPLSPISFAQGLGPQSYEDPQGAFVGENMTWSIVPIQGLTMKQDGFIEVDTDKTEPQSGTTVEITVTNSVGSAASTTTLEITETVLNFTGLTGNVADVEDFVSIGGALSNGREIDSYKWGSTPGGSEYGGNVNPAPFAVGTLYLEVEAALTYSAEVEAFDFLKFDTQPGFVGTPYLVGDTVTLTEGTASPSATITVEYFRFNGVDKSGELVGLTWDSTGSEDGVVTAQFRASTAGQADVLSNEISASLNPVPVVIPPIIRSMVVGPMEGSIIPVEFDFSEDQPTPYTVSIVMVAANAPAPTSVQVQAGDDASDTPATVAANYLVSADGTINVDVGAVADGTYDLYATVEDADGDLWGDVAVGEDVVVTNPIPFIFDQIGVYQGRSETELVSEFFFDLSGYEAGDEILIFFGCDSYTASIELDEAAALPLPMGVLTTKISTDRGAAGSNKLSLHKYVMTKTGEAGTRIIVTKQVAENNNMIALFGIKGGSIGTGSAVSAIYRSTGTVALSGTLTPTGPDNYFLVCSISTVTAIVEGQMVFTGVSQLGPVQTAPNPSNRPMVLAGLARNGNAAPLAYTFNGPTSGPLAVLGVAITAD